MRKTPTLLVGLLATGAIAGTAIAQTAGTHTLDVSVTPSKAGTKKKPKAVTFKLDLSNSKESKTTASRIEISLPSGLRMNPKGFPKCPAPADATVEFDADACPTKSRLGTGTADAVTGPSDPNPQPVRFENTFFVGSGTSLTIFLKATEIDFRRVLVGKISNGGRKLTINIPEDTQQPAPGTYAALTDIVTTLKGTAGTGRKKHGFFELSRCKGGKLKVTSKLTYAPNPNPPAAGSSTATDNVTCKR